MTEAALATGSLVLSPVHHAYLSDHAVADEVIRSASVYSASDISTQVPVPDPAGAYIIFPWKDDPEVTFQYRIWPEPPGDPGDRKYVWNLGRQGRSSHFWALRPLRDDSGPVIIAEGTKQALAVASWAPAEYAVFGMSGCDGWRNLELARLSRFAGRQVIIMLDADAATKLRVYEGGEGLARELRLEDAAEVGFVPSPAWGSGGIDDYLAKIEGPRRQERLSKLISMATAKAADRKPKAQAQDLEPAEPDTHGLPRVIVNNDRLQVIQEILHWMRQAYPQQLFSYGGVITRLRGTATEPLDKDSFARWMVSAVAMYKYRSPTMSSPGSFEAAWPEPQTIGALLASGDEFPSLERVSQAPFIDAQGEVVAKNGHDWHFNPATGLWSGSGVMLVMGNSGMDRLRIPDSPSQADAARAAAYLLDEWLGDMPWRDEASRANALALALTPFIRGLVPLVPLAVISGLQMGVGKNLLADCLSLMLTGQMVQTLPWIPDDDDENRKQILSAFRGGTSLFCLDEAHDIGGTALARAITSTTYADRILGVSKQASYPNTVTWMALGNQVTVNADMARRAYFIELYPPDPDPQDRPDSMFRHPDLRTWTAENRPELVTAALILIRSWYAAGQPGWRRDIMMGSFEPWDKMMTSILGHAGVPGFLSNLTTRRAERDTSGGYWTEHLTWLRSQFGDVAFTCLEVKARAAGSGGTWDAPPRLNDPMTTDFTRSLGQAYHRNADRWYGSSRIVKSGTGHGTKVQWRIEERGPGSVHPVHPQKDLSPDQGRMDWMDQAGTGGNTASVSVTGGVLSGHVLADQGFSEVAESAVVAPPAKTKFEEGMDGPDGSLLPLPHVRAGAGAPPRARVEGTRARPSDPSGPYLGFDLETADAGDIFRWPRGQAGEDGTGYVRLAGITGPGGSAIVPVPDLLTLMGVSGRVYGHNILGFDGLALAWHESTDCRAFWDWFCSRAMDTELIARQAYPPRSRESGSSEDKRGLDAVAALLGLPGKTDDLARLKRKFGGYDKIPLDDPEYRSYLLDGDLPATHGIAGRLLRHYDTDPYLPREHKLAAIAGHMSLNGLHVDQKLLRERLEAGEDRKRKALGLLHGHWGLPLSREVMRGRGKARHPEEQVFDSPLSTDEGRAWLEAQYERYQVPDPPRTAKTGKLALGAEDLKRVTADPACPEDLRAMIAMMNVVTTTRTVYQTAADWLCPDGRVHPKISFRQASGRWSVTEPGLTVFGKHGGRHHERDIFTAPQGRVLMSFDLSQVDMRAIAWLSGDPAYRALFEPGRDPHAEIAAQLGIARQDAKPIAHGWNYGRGADAMIKSGLDPGKVWAFIRGMEDRFPVLITWRESVREAARAGQVLLNGFGRRMLAEPARAYTVGPALMGQGGARDILGECMLRLDPALHKYLLLQVHDELVFEFPEDDWRDRAAAVREAMTWDLGGVPILADESGPGCSFGEISAK